jgi:uncharacterized protein (DUF849 family)
VKIMAEIIHAAMASRPELEVFDTGDIVLAQRSDEAAGVHCTSPALFSIVTGDQIRLPLASTDVMATAARMLPRDAANGRASASAGWRFPMAVQAYLLGGHVRVGLEDSSYISRKGVLAKGNGELVERARDLIEKLGGRRWLGPSEAQGDARACGLSGAAGALETNDMTAQASAQSRQCAQGFPEIAGSR